MPDRWTHVRIGLVLLIAAILSGCSLANHWKLVYEQNFDQPGWDKDWRLQGSVGPTDKDALFSGGGILYARLNKTFNVPCIRMEFDGTTVEKDRDGDVGDLSCQVEYQFFRLGCECNSLTLIEGTGWFFPVDNPPMIVPGKTHRIVAEIAGRLCTFTVDGRVAGQRVLDEPMSKMDPQLYAFAGIARFDNLKIFTKDQPDPLSPEWLRKVAEREESVKPPALAPAMKAGTLRAYATIHSLGFEWDIAGDGNHNAKCEVRYRVKGAQEWKSALPLLRIDYRGRYGKGYAYRHFNMFAGSVMFLDPGATYEVELKATDPDGGEGAISRVISTRPVPALAEATRVFHVAPGNGGGLGTKDDPFRGIEAAQAVAQPGDTFLLRAGTYPGFVADKSGEEGEYIAWKASPDGETVITSRIGVKASHLWFEGLTFDQGGTGKGIRGLAEGAEDVVITRNTFRDCRYAVSNVFADWVRDDDPGFRHWYVADNVMTAGAATEYGFRIHKLVDSDICFNRIDGSGNGGDAISLRMCRSVDVYGNDARKIDDDAIEPDGSYANIRIWENRMTGHFEAVSFQPMLCSPWYIIRNEFSTPRNTLKNNVIDRFVFVNNTIVIRSNRAQGRGDALLRSISRNNLWIIIPRKPQEAVMWTGTSWTRNGPWSNEYQALPDWKTDVDYDGFDWDGAAKAFEWELPGKEMQEFPDIESFSKFLGIEQHGIRVKKEDIFETPSVADYWDATFPAERLTLKPGGNAIDAGAPLPNICDQFNGKAPDLGAHELGAPPTQYGPRAQ